MNVSNKNEKGIEFNGCFFGLKEVIQKNILLVNTMFIIKKNKNLNSFVNYKPSICYFTKKNKRKKIDLKKIFELHTEFEEINKSYFFYHNCIEIPIYEKSHYFNYVIEVNESQKKIYDKQGYIFIHSKDEFSALCFSCNGSHDKKIELDHIENTLGGFDNVWSKLLKQKKNKTYLVCLGDFIYMDDLWVRYPLLEKLKNVAIVSKEMKKKILEHFIERYFDFLKIENVQKVNQSMISINLYDDHDTSINGFGTVNEFFKKSSLYRSIEAISHLCYSLFQLKEDPKEFKLYTDLEDLHEEETFYLENNKVFELSKPSFSKIFEYDNLTVISLDTRTFRSRDKILEEGLLQKIELYLKQKNYKHFDKKNNILLLVSLPLGYYNANLIDCFVPFLNEKNGIKTDVLDQWWSNDHVYEAKRILNILHKVALHSNSDVYVISGDTHIPIYCETKIKYKIQSMYSRNVFHITTSPLCNKPQDGFINRVVSYLSNKFDIDELEDILFDFRKWINIKNKKKHWFMEMNNFLSLHFQISEEKRNITLHCYTKDKDFQWKPDFQKNSTCTIQ